MKDRRPICVLISQALNEQLYDKIQAQPEEKPAAPVRMVKNKKKQITSAAELPRARSPKSNRTLEASAL